MGQLKKIIYVKLDIDNPDLLYPDHRHTQGARAVSQPTNHPHSAESSPFIF